MALGKHHLLTLNHMLNMAKAKKEVPGDFESAATKILKVLQEAIRFDAAWILKIDPSSLNILNIYLHQFCQKAFSKYLDLFYAKSPVPTIRQIKNEGFISKKGSDLIEKESWMKNPFYIEIIQPLGFHGFLSCACINQKQEYVGYIVLWRSNKRQDFSCRDCFFLEKASVHCAALLDQVKLLKTDCEKPEILRLVTRRSSPGVIVLGKENEVVFINQEAKNVFAILKSGKACLSNPEDEMFLQKLQRLKEKILQNISSTQNPDLFPVYLIFTFRGTTFTCRGFPLEGNAQNQGSVMILIERVKEEVHVSPSFTMNGLEFTARENTIAGLIGGGLTNKEIAGELGIGIHTVKDHIKNIMGKLKTHTRSGIVAKIMVN